VFAITAVYTAFVGFVDAVTGANYMFLRDPPVEWTLLRVLGPWPWYVVSASGVGLVLLVLLDLPFWPGRRRAREGTEQVTRPLIHPPGASLGHRPQGADASRHSAPSARAASRRRALRASAHR
jgi:hypothetical protein